MTSEPDLNLLIVDDDEVDVEAVVRAVRRSRLPFGLYTAKNGEEALEVLRKEQERSNKPFLVLLDLNMPDSDGFEFLDTIREDPELRQSMVFVLSSSNRDEDRKRAYDHLVAGYLVKSDLAPGYDRLVELVRSYSSTVRLPKS